MSELSPASDESVLVNNNPIDEVERALLELPQIECPVEHLFVPGFYIRVFHAPKGAHIISKIHNTTHSFSISKGSVSIWEQEKGWTTLTAPYSGITTPGTRRALIVHEDLVFTTAHPTCETDLVKIEELLIEDRKNPLLTEEKQLLLDSIKQFHAQNPDKKELIQ